MKIDVYCNDGSPIGVLPSDIYGHGVGGAELSLLTWAETMVLRGHQVIIYNDPPSPGVHNGVEFQPQAAFQPHDGQRDIFVAYRSPNRFLQVVTAGMMKVHWSTDQYTVSLQSGGTFATEVFPFVDRIVCISPFHHQYHLDRYHPESEKIGWLDLGVRLQDYTQDLSQIEKIPGRCIFCSVPDRGLIQLYQMWGRIVDQVPEASLVITSDYRLWGKHLSAGNQAHRLQWYTAYGGADGKPPSVIFLGKVDRKRLVKEQEASVCLSYPCIYNELFCISVAECQVAGAIPVTSQVGAIGSTNQWGHQVEGVPQEPAFQQEFVERVVETLNNGQWQEATTEARTRFNWQIICEKWEHLFQTGEFCYAKEART
jgi:glycosyltransferase involved in cell wall biosynthesis